MITLRDAVVGQHVPDISSYLSPSKHTTPRRHDKDSPLVEHHQNRKLSTTDTSKTSINITAWFLVLIDEPRNPRKLRI